MSDDKDSKPPGPPEPPPAPGDEPRTVFMPGGFTTPAAAPPPLPEPPPPAPAPAVSAPSPTTPKTGAAAIKVGDVLNHIFKVDRFLARGGMGEVFVGCNVNTDEKVAIKVMLPALAGDEKVVAMFRREARTLTRLNHPALVQYRVLAQEPQLQILYIVTDYIEGTNLGAALGTLRLSPDQLAGLLRRLASGLDAAHKLGAVHRDMSPDNVILENDDVHEAKIIDFGIAKDLEASSATIVGDGFAGKLNYVAPEQLGDFGREIGPWSDVYSLGLVMLAVSLGRNVDMSGSLVDAIDKRRRGPDLSGVPGRLRPLLEAMLRPDPKERLRSMDEVLAMLERARLGGDPAPEAAPAPTSPGSPPAPAPAPMAAYSQPGAGSGTGASAFRPLLIILTILLGIAAILAVVWLATGGTFGAGTDDRVRTSKGANPAAPPPDDAGRVALARATLNSALPQVSCTWLDIAAIEGGVPITVTMRGVAGDKQSAEWEVGQVLTRAGLAAPRLRFGDVATITPAGCAALDTFRQVRSSGPPKISVARTRFEMATLRQGDNAGRLGAQAAVEIDTGGAPDFALVGIEPSGEITTLIPSRDALTQLMADEAGRIADRGNGRYRLSIDVTHTRWSGLFFLTGSDFDASLLAPPVGARGSEWQQQFLAAASQGNWRGDMVWFETVDQVAG